MMSGYTSQQCSKATRRQQAMAVARSSPQSRIDNDAVISSWQGSSVPVHTQRQEGGKKHTRRTQGWPLAMARFFFWTLALGAISFMVQYHRYVWVDNPASDSFYLSTTPMRRSLLLSAGSFESRYRDVTSKRGPPNGYLPAAAVLRAQKNRQNDDRNDQYQSSDDDNSFPSEQPLQQWASIVSDHPLVSNRSVLDVPLALYQNTTSPVSDLLRVYVYDFEREHNLESSPSVSTLDQRDMTSSSNHSSSNAFSLPHSYTDDVFEWLTTERFDSNWITDLVLVRLFSSFPGRVYDPNEADIFVVPYPHAGHCLSSPSGYSVYCKQLNKKKHKKNENASVEQTVLRSLEHYNATTNANRHLFLLSDSEFLAQRWLASRPLLVKYGPLWEHPASPRRFSGNGKRKTRRKPRRYRSPPGHILIPPANADLRLQPAFVVSPPALHGSQQQQQQQPQHREPLTRDLSLVFVASDTNPRMPESPRVFRRFLLQALEEWSNKKGNNTIGGLPFVATNNVRLFEKSAFSASNGNDSSSTNDTNENATISVPNISTNKTTHGDLYDLYRRSVFCPILPGDSAWQRRFFDAMACGCVPVVISYELKGKAFRNHLKQYHGSTYAKNEEDTTTQMQFPNKPVSWYVPEDGPHNVGDTWSVQESYPFVDQIDYRSFVVECNGNATHPEVAAHELIQTLERMLFLERGMVVVTADRSLQRSGTPAHTAVLNQKQAALQRSAASVLYGVGPDAHRTDDAFAHLIRALRAYVDGLEYAH